MQKRRCTNLGLIEKWAMKAEDLFSCCFKKTNKTVNINHASSFSSCYLPSTNFCPGDNLGGIFDDEKSMKVSKLR